MKRKLTTILYADGAGYSDHIERDEQGTVLRLKRARGIMREIFAAHDGREVNSWGDAVIAEFPSVVEAVRAAVAIQDAIATENLSHPEEARMAFRIGINLGDVMVDGDNLLGDGVNVAARLESLAEPGGIVVSGNVHSLVHRQLAVGFDFAGDEVVKGHEDPVPSWRVVMPGRNAPAEAAAAPAPGPRPAPGPPPDLFARVGRFIDRVRAWLRAQPRGVQRAAGLIAVFLTLNVLFTGIAAPWFIFPSAPFAFYIWRHYNRTRGQGRGDVKW